MKIPFLDLSAQIKPHKEQYLELISKVIDDTAFASGKYVEEFETNFAKYNNSNYAIAVNSGTSALHLALRAFGIGAGDEVILPSHTFIATAWAVSYVGATPVFVDVDEKYYTINPNFIEEKITNNTKAIIPVHLYGQAADLSPIVNLCKKYNLILVEDASQAHGVKYKINGEEKTVGTIGDIGCFSFYPGKNLGAFGEGGAVITNNFEISEKIKSLRNHAQTERYVHNDFGYNYRMDGIQGTVLNYKLDLLNNWNNRRDEIAQKYSSAFSSKGRIKIPTRNPKSTHIYHLYELKLNSKAERESLINYLADNGISTGLHYPIPIHLQQPYIDLNYKGKLPTSENLAETLISLPIYAELSDDMVDYIIEKVLDWVNL